MSRTDPGPHGSGQWVGRWRVGRWRAGLPGLPQGEGVPGYQHSLSEADTQQRKCLHAVLCVTPMENPRWRIRGLNHEVGGRGFTSLTGQGAVPPDPTPLCSAKLGSLSPQAAYFPSPKRGSSSRGFEQKTVSERAGRHCVPSTHRRQLEYCDAVAKTKAKPEGVGQHLRSHTPPPFPPLEGLL